MLSIADALQAKCFVSHSVYVSWTVYVFLCGRFAPEIRDVWIL